MTFSHIMLYAIAGLGVTCVMVTFPRVALFLILSIYFGVVLAAFTGAI